MISEDIYGYRVKVWSNIAYFDSWYVEKVDKLEFSQLILFNWEIDSNKAKKRDEFTKMIEFLSEIEQLRRTDKLRAQSISVHFKTE